MDKFQNRSTYPDSMYAIVTPKKKHGPISPCMTYKNPIAKLIAEILEPIVSAKRNERTFPRNTNRQSTNTSYNVGESLSFKKSMHLRRNNLVEDKSGQSISDPHSTLREDQIRDQIGGIASSPCPENYYLTAYRKKFQKEPQNYPGSTQPEHLDTSAADTDSDINSKVVLSPIAISVYESFGIEISDSKSVAPFTFLDELRDEQFNETLQSVFRDSVSSSRDTEYGKHQNHSAGEVSYSSNYGEFASLGTSIDTEGSQEDQVRVSGKEIILQICKEANECVDEFSGENQRPNSISKVKLGNSNGKTDNLTLLKQYSAVQIQNDETTSNGKNGKPVTNFDLTTHPNFIDNLISEKIDNVEQKSAKEKTHTTEVNPIDLFKNSAAQPSTKSTSVIHKILDQSRIRTADFKSNSNDSNFKKHIQIKKCEVNRGLLQQIDNAKVIVESGKHVDCEISNTPVNQIGKPVSSSTPNYGLGIKRKGSFKPPRMNNVLTSILDKNPLSRSFLNSQSSDEEEPFIRKINKRGLKTSQFKNLLKTQSTSSSSNSFKVPIIPSKKNINISKSRQHSESANNILSNSGILDTDKVNKTNGEEKENSINLKRKLNTISGGIKTISDAKKKNKSDLETNCLKKFLKAPEDNKTKMADCDPSSTYLGIIKPVTELLSKTNVFESAEEICMTLVYKNGSCQLREFPGESVKRTRDSNSSQVASLVLKIKQVGKDAKTTTDLFKVPMGRSFDRCIAKEVITKVMQADCPKVCFDAQEMIAYLVDKLELNYYDVIRDWLVVDPKVGVWLLDADHPPTTFREVKIAVQRKKNSIDGISADTSEGTDSSPPASLLSDLLELSVCTQSLKTLLTRMSLWALFYHLEMRLTVSLAVMELRGIKVDMETLQNNGKLLSDKITFLELSCQRIASAPINISSPVQLRALLYDKLKLDKKVAVPKTPTGLKSTNEAALTLLKDLHPLPNLLLTHRTLNKIKNTFVEGVKAHVVNGYISPAWEQTSAATGRVQCKAPNLQTLPKFPVSLESEDTEVLNQTFSSHHFSDCDDEEPELLPSDDCSDKLMVCARSVLVAESNGFVLLSGDFQQMELRLVAHFSQDKVLMECFKSSQDVFDLLSTKWLGSSFPTTSDRDRTKRLVYASLYGAGREKLSQVLKITKEQAEQAMKSFGELVPGIADYRQKVLQQVRQQGYLLTLFKRRRYFPNINSTNFKLRSYAQRQAINFVIQGSAADICKAAQVRTEMHLAKHLQLITGESSEGVGRREGLLLHIHDELVWQIHHTAVDKFVEFLFDTMENTQSLCHPHASITVPLPISVKVGTSWGKMEPYGG